MCNKNGLKNVKGSAVPVLKHYIMKMCGEVGVKLSIFLTSALEQSTSCSCHQYPLERLGGPQSLSGQSEEKIPAPATN
jgi:hypothetical protein